ncbi:ATP-binding protein [Candidatus Poriferisodalis sp.]|uniref:ATP-binding protein n=1 Tax=Candidatus Poriferisodalis sp. TaxID=3101277 RepID=UPI003B515F18
MGTRTGDDLGLSLVEVGNFLRATRDSGYRSAATAVSEFVDNSIQAGAELVEVHVTRGDCAEYPVEIVVADDGTGMSAADLSSALAFGGSSRFDDRSSLGRYGMGLPNAALSLARRVEVFSWQCTGGTYLSTLDLDEIAAADDNRLVLPSKVERPRLSGSGPHGTVIHLRRCDRLGYRRPSTIAKKLLESFSRTYRHFLRRGLAISVNGEPLSPVDPLFLETGGEPSAMVFGEPLRYHLSTDTGRGTVEVLFSELPVEAWCDLPAQEKRRLGITNTANVAIVRADREVDSGWWFMGNKRRQNYDDWWRCEIRFDPVLDELFGITHTKQQITPSPYLRDLLSKDLEPIANALNARVRRRFELARTRGPLADAARTAALCARSLPPLRGGPSASPAYQIDVGQIVGTPAFTLEAVGQDISVVLNERHPLYRDVLRPLAESATPADHRTAKRVGLVLLAMARAEAAADPMSGRDEAEWFRREWSDVAATFLNA